MIHFILQMLAFQLLFLIVYDLFLKKETFFNLNRAYLLITPIISCILPFIKISWIQEYIPQQYIIKLPPVLIGTDTTAREITLSEVLIESSASLSEYFTVSIVLAYIWYLGLIISLCVFCFKYYKILRFKKLGNKIKIENIDLISIPNTTAAFSFFNTIFIGTSLSELKKANILLHEKVHVKEYHSLDLIFFEILRILFWFNPLVYVYQNRIALLQEYIADAKAVSETNKKEYYQDLLSQIFQTEKISFINTFFNHSLIKKRIDMLQKSKSKKILQLKYLLLLPVIATMLIYSSCTEETIAQDSTTEAAETPLLQKLEAVKQQIAMQGTISPEEEKALKVLSALMDDDISKEEYKDITNDLEIPFGVIDKVPVFPGCENLSPSETKRCFSKNVAELVGNKFNTEIGKNSGLSGRQKILVKFKIDNQGKVVDIAARGPEPQLETEAIRVLNQLPKMTPGVQDGVNVSVMYSLPIVFEIK